MHDVAGQLAHAGGLELVDGVVVGALILRVHEDLILRFVKVIHDLLDALGVGALQRIPEGVRPAADGENREHEGAASQGTGAWLRVSSLDGILP